MGLGLKLQGILNNWQEIIGVWLLFCLQISEEKFKTVHKFVEISINILSATTLQ